MSPTPTFDVARSDDDLRGILELQQANVEEVLEPDEVAREGFVTLRHDLELLREMAALGDHVVARDGSRVVGYALFLDLELRPRFPGLEPMMREIEDLTWKGAPLRERRYFVMGQVCVARTHRGSGTFEGLYTKLRDVHADRFELCLTEIAYRNARSRRAHAKVGFELLRRYEHDPGAVAQSSSDGQQLQVAVRRRKRQTVLPLHLHV